MHYVSLWKSGSFFATINLSNLPNLQFAKKTNQALAVCFFERRSRDDVEAFAL